MVEKLSTPTLVSQEAHQRRSAKDSYCCTMMKERQKGKTRKYCRAAELNRNQSVGTFSSPNSSTELRKMGCCHRAQRCRSSHQEFPAFPRYPGTLCSLWILSVPRLA
ncbi:hypothetical protein SAY87_013882 [Trapa incisa]|uniref:Uncharacterized protein n=1 Tax=Trapa incisa TaxID=236973 RepID=A0AAN7KGD2_9MYRT|nr:hypothetical protein SAY87_013882 [Trapa incisa]